MTRRASLGTATVLALALLGAPAWPREAAWTPGKQEVRVPVRDGKELAADLHLPEKPGKYPVVVIQTPYGKRHHGDEKPRGTAGGVYERQSYAYLVVDWRGFHGSRGARVRGRRTPLGNDGYDVVEWAAEQPWSNGRIGTWGPSALGKVQFETAASAPPHLVCSVPLVAAYGHRYEDYYEGGVLGEHHLKMLDRLGFGVFRAVTNARVSGAPVYRVTKRAERYGRINLPMLVITGWYDHGTARHLETFANLIGKAGPKARAGARLLIGPWHHTALGLEEQGALSYPDAAGEIERETGAFFDHHLRGVRNSAWAERPRVLYWRLNEKGWKGADAWPVAEEQQRTCVLHGDGTIDGKAAAPDEKPRTIVADPGAAVPTIGGANLPFGLVAGPRDQAELLVREDVLAYTTAVLDAPLRVDGTPRITFTLRTDRPDVDVAVRLCQVLPDGRSMLVADSIQRAQLRAGTVRPQRVRPGEPFELTVTLPPLAVTFPKGHRLRLIVAGSNWPRFERNTHTGRLAWDEDKAVIAKIDFLSGRLVLPTLP